MILKYKKEKINNHVRMKEENRKLEIPEERKFTEIELYELIVPGKILGKEVIDASAKRIGIVRSIRLSLQTLPQIKAEIVVKGLEVEFPVDIENIQAVGDIVQLKTIIKEARGVDVREVMSLRKKILEEIKAYIANI